MNSALLAAAPQLNILEDLRAAMPEARESH